MEPITINTDGASRGNPGPAAIAYVIKQTDQPAVEYKQAIGVTTNNQAEYQAMVSALQKACSLNLRDSLVEVLSDSELIVHQLNGRYRVKDANLKPLYQEAVSFLQRLRANGNVVTLSPVRREHNQQADRLANQALDSPS